MIRTFLSSLLPFSCLLLLIACAPKPNQHSPVKNSRGFEMLIGQFTNNIERLWGPSGVIIADPKVYVKYYDQFQTRSHINFDKGIVTVETLVTTSPKERLHTAITHTLLMSEASSEQPFDAAKAPASQRPFLYQQVVDQDHRPITSYRHARLFADHLLRKKLRRRTINFRPAWTITIPLVAGHIDRRAHQHLRAIQRAARQYGVDAGLILAIIQVESSFNPRAKTQSNALGLMQVIPDHAGKDVFFRIKNRRGKPSRRYLFNPQKNIDTGTAYLHLLHTVYLAKINDPTARRYAVISAYNSGVGSVMRTFSPDKRCAISIINRLSPEEVYQALLTRHPSAQARNYLHAVNNALRHYRHALPRLARRHALSA